MVLFDLGTEEKTSQTEQTKGRNICHHEANTKETVQTVANEEKTPGATDLIPSQRQWAPQQPLRPAKSRLTTLQGRPPPHSEFSRIRRPCSREEDFQTQAQDLEARFNDRQYKPEWITSARRRFEGLCLKDPPNLRNLLVRAHHPPQSDHFLHQIPQGNYKCGKCAQCNFTTKTKSFNHPLTGKPLHIKGVITCNTNNVIYMLRFPCGLAYIGKTTRSLKTRIAEHRSNIRNHNDKSPVAIHFTTAKHNVSSLRYTGIEHVKCPSRGGDVNSLLLRREAYWIYTLGTLSPRGMNEDFDLRPFL
ncbi:uncharacterized protein LOC121693623 [Alosa sapidissima]|uniref:uncharacterized protein LOC121693623 n=1 Tax=Alosa sapidissima TaxID=34773 RepID=UPI001C084235|nr:uncharacterized protein LOC121693623 [Alosa sapidissima]